MHWFASACGGHKGSRACTHTCTAHRFMVGTVQCSTLPMLVVECLHPFPLVSTTFRVHFRGTAVLPDVLPSTFVCACPLPVCSGCKGYGISAEHRYASPLIALTMLSRQGLSLLICLAVCDHSVCHAITYPPLPFLYSNTRGCSRVQTITIR